jgi:hypothetical protein
MVPRGGDNAAAFLRWEIPAALSKKIDWSRLQNEPGSFFDSHYRHAESDLLFLRLLSLLARNQNLDLTVWYICCSNTRPPKIALSPCAYCATWYGSGSPGSKLIQRPPECPSFFL